MKRFTSKTQKTGELGEKICVAFLQKTRFEIIEQNYTKSFGEIDIIAVRNSKLHFIEVKSIKLHKVSYETYNPAENFTKVKYLKVWKTAKAYLAEKNVSPETSWQIDLYSIYIDTENNHHKVSKIEDVVFS